MLRRWARAAGTQTEREKAALLNGTDLFFGALLGVNLATAQGLPLGDKLTLITGLFGAVVTLTIFSVWERRGDA